MFLSKVEIDRFRPEVRSALADCQQMHRLVTGMFGKDRESAQALYRTNIVGNKLNIYIYSHCSAVRLPSCDIQQRDITSWLNQMKENQVWSFDLIAAPTKKVSVDGKKNSQRRILKSPEERKSWLDRKAEQFGFQILYCQEQEQVHVNGKHNPESGGKMYHDGYRYQGTLRITNVTEFRKALELGIGPSKAYGFGMMMLKA